MKNIFLVLLGFVLTAFVGLQAETSAPADSGDSSNSGGSITATPGDTGESGTTTLKSGTIVTEIPSGSEAPAGEDSEADGPGSRAEELRDRSGNRRERLRDNIKTNRNQQYLDKLQKRRNNMKNYAPKDSDSSKD